ncbi:MAG: hypothetical protein QM763_08020 [Agriterribacter sp.]
MGISTSIDIFRSTSSGKKIVLSIFLLLYGITSFMFSFRFEADKMFYQPKNKNFAAASINKVASGKLILGVQNRKSIQPYG